MGDHDENVSYEEVAREVGAETAAQLRQFTLAVYQRARDIALDRGIILADTKFEFGYGAEDGGDGIGVPPESDVGLVLGDEVLTPDSSRFWPADQWKPGRPQPSFDKQFVRDWLAGAGVRLGPRAARRLRRRCRRRSWSRRAPSTRRPTGCSPGSTGPEPPPVHGRAVRRRPRFVHAVNDSGPNRPHVMYAASAR